jgi:aminomethyltransferase
MQDSPAVRAPIAGSNTLASRILRPGIRVLPPGVERHVVDAGSLIVVGIEPGDQVTVIDTEGRQTAELIAADTKGRIDPGILGRKGSGDGKGIKAALASPEESARIVRRGLERRRIDLASARSIRLFSGTSSAGSRQTLKVDRAGVLVVCAPGGPMDAVKQDTTTSLEVLLRRARPERSDGSRNALPEPLADPLQDIRIKAATASAFLVREGEFVQIIDVDGRQCTDFQCFSARKLDHGREVALDMTATRSMTGLGYPAPGLPSKGWDMDLDPLVEIVRDTCGRHDSFGLACTSRYYDDIGYPGHVNCTENFNRALAPYGVKAREGWMALNFFYNTGIDRNNVLFLDEPWSRPGDYVLMKALTDIVCVSSSCPDDTSAANAWDPTDIHVRTYSGKQSFSRAVAFRMKPDADAKLTKETAFHSCFARHTRAFGEYRGYWLASHFNNGGTIDEYWAAREGAIITDLSPLRKFEVTGPDAEALMQLAVTRDIAKLAQGQVVYTAMCYEHGGMIDDATVFRLGPNNFRFIGGDEYCGEHLRGLAGKHGFKAWVRSSTDQLCNVQVQGPRSRDILKDLIWTAPAQTKVEELEWFRFSVGRIGHFKGAPIVVSRTGYTGELGYEVFCHPKDAVAVFDAIWEAGEPHGLKPLGLAALDMLRIEAGLVFANYEFNDDTDPFEAGIGFTVPRSKEADYLGKAALQRRREHPKLKLVGLEVDAKEAVGHGDCVHIGRARVGLVTSGCRSPKLNKTIALARVDASAAVLGTEVEVGKLDGHQKRLPARIVRFPHYDPEKTRVRG